MVEPVPTEAVVDAAALRRGRWLRQLHRWHWISSALSLVGMLAFAITGLTLNNAGLFEAARPSVQHLQATLPPALRADLAESRTLSPALRDWLRAQWSVALPAAELQPEDQTLVAEVERPGGAALLRLNTANGQAELELSDRGWVAYLNDLHKGRHAGTAWSWFIDAFAIACLVFCVTGLLILQLHSRSRPLVWPLTAAGLVLPLLLALLFIH